MKRIAIAESDRKTRDAIVKTLSAEFIGVPIESVGGLMESSPDLVVLDVDMPEMDGLDVLRELRERGPEGVPVMVLTDSTAAGNEAVALGASEYLEKPIRRDALLKAVRRLLEGGKSSSGTRLLELRLEGLHNEVSGRIDATKVADYLGIPLSSLSAALAVSYKAVQKTPDAPALQSQLQPLKRTLEILEQVFSDKSRVRIWLNSPHADLGGRTPMSVILKGRSEVLADMLESALMGLPA